MGYQNKLEDESIDRFCRRLKTSEKQQQKQSQFSGKKLNGVAFNAVQGFAKLGIRIFRHPEIYGMLIDATVTENPVFQGFISNPKNYEVGAIIEHPILVNNYRVIEKDEFFESDFDCRKGKSEAVSRVLALCNAEDKFGLAKLLKMAVSGGVCKLILPLKIVYVEFDNREFSEQ